MKKKSTVSTITKRCNSNVENLKEETFPCNESVQWVDDCGSCLIVGTLYGWSLILYGTTFDPLLNNPHVPTLSTDITFKTPETEAFTTKAPSTTSRPSQGVGKLWNQIIYLITVVLLPSLSSAFSSAILIQMSVMQRHVFVLASIFTSPDSVFNERACSTVLQYCSYIHVLTRFLLFGKIRQDPIMDNRKPRWML